MIKKLIPASFLIAINVLLFTAVQPYVQEATNRHLERADVITILSFLSGIGLIVYGILLLNKRKRRSLDLPIVLLGLSLLFWAYSFGTLECSLCAKA